MPDFGHRIRPYSSIHTALSRWVCGIFAENMTLRTIWQICTLIHEEMGLIHTDKVSFSSQNGCYLTQVRPSQIFTFLDKHLGITTIKAQIFRHNDLKNQAQKNKAFATGIDLSGRLEDCFNREDDVTNYTCYLL